MTLQTQPLADADGTSKLPSKSSSKLPSKSPSELPSKSSSKLPSKSPSELPTLTLQLVQIFQKRVEKFRQLEKKMSDSNLLRDSGQLEKLGREYSRERGYMPQIKNFLRTHHEFGQTEELLHAEAGDVASEEMRELVREEWMSLRQDLLTQSESMRELLLETDPNEGCDLFLEIRAATGGAEAALFVGDLLRMYKYFTQRQKIAFDMISGQATELGGYKEVIVEMKGKLAYRFFQHEAGTHRVQRIPETEAGGRIHTSTVTVAVIPAIQNEAVEFNHEDLEVDVYRASGAGGQHVNTTESAIRITHRPSGIVVTCQDERSQHKNKAKAMKVLHARIIQHEESKRHEEAASLKRAQIKTGERSERIRTYNFPQGRLSDHRIGFHSHNLTEIMDGALDELCAALLSAQKEVAIAEQISDS